MGSREVAVIGGGSWATALAVALARAGNRVSLLVRDEARAEEINRDRRNRRYLPDTPLPDRVFAQPLRADRLAGRPLLIHALPCAALRGILPMVAPLNAPLVAACKGLDEESGERIDTLLLSALGPKRALLLSGPSFADEVAAGRPTALTLAATDLSLARRVLRHFEGSNLRPYPHDDLPGVALGGALKNVIAIAAGIARELDLGHNAMAALITRGIAEMVRLALACGARRETLYGLSGLGDLVLTCSGRQSRNRRLGRKLARGMAPDEARRAIGQVVEGERTARAGSILPSNTSQTAAMIGTSIR